MRKIKNLTDLTEKRNAYTNRAVVLEERISRILSQNLNPEQLEEAQKYVAEYSKVTQIIELLNTKEKMIHLGLAYPASMNAELNSLENAIEEIEETSKSK